MAAFETKPSTGALFRNDRKEEERHPDYNGKIALPDGTEHFLNAWIKTAKSGKKFMSLSIGKPVQWKDDAGPRASLKSELSDDIPFAPEWR